MNKPIVRVFLAGLVVLMGSMACSIGPLVISVSSTPTVGAAPVTTAAPIPPTDTPASAPVLVPTDTPVLDMETILANNGFIRNKTLDTGCATSCSAYKNSDVNVIADYYYTNKSFSLLFYGQDPNGQTEQATSAAVAQLLTQLYPGTLSDDVIAVVNTFPDHIGNSHGTSGNFNWSVSVKVVYNLDKTIKKATIYIGITPG